MTFPASGGQAVDPTSVLNNTAGVSLTSGTLTLTILGSPVLIDASSLTFRYFFTGYSGTSPVTVTFNGGWKTSDGSAWGGTPTQAGTTQFGSWIDVQLTPVGAATITPTQLSSRPAQPVAAPGPGPPRR